MMRFEDFDLMSIGNTVAMVGGVWEGNGKMFVCLFPESHSADKSKINMLRMTADQWKVFLRQADIVETEVLAKTEDGKLYKAVARKSQRAVDQKVSWNVYRRDRYTCRYCGNDECPLTVDHLVLWEEGGPSTEENLVTSCRKCNKTRGNIQYQDWLDHQYYRRVSNRLTPEIRAINEGLAGTLDAITRVITVRKKR